MNNMQTILTLVLLATLASLQAQDAEITVGASTGQTVGPYLTGYNVVYNHENMDTWQDGTKVAALQEAGVSCLRYPGGHVVSFWDWEFPYHSAYQDFWDPEYIQSLTPEKKAELKAANSQRMGLDDFLWICAESGAVPVVGINMFQGYKYDRLEDSIAKAVRLVEYCKKQNPKVTYYYLDNEAGHQPAKGKHIPVPEYIDLLESYSTAIKAVQPDAKLMVNPIGWRSNKGLIEQSGQHIDLIDFHWYYNTQGWARFRTDDWRQNTDHRKFHEVLPQLSQWTEQSGHHHIRASFMEWNLGAANGEDDTDLSTFHLQGLVQADMLMQYVEHDVFMAAVWPLMWKRKGNSRQGGFLSFFDQETGEASASKHIMRFFSKAQRGTVMESTDPSESNLYSTAVLGKDEQSIFLYVLNKGAKAEGVTVQLPKAIARVSAESFEELGNSGEATAKALQPTLEDQTISFTMTGMSVVFLELEISR